MLKNKNELLRSNGGGHYFLAEFYVFLRGPGFFNKGVNLRSCKNKFCADLEAGLFSPEKNNGLKLDFIDFIEPLIMSPNYKW